MQIQHMYKLVTHEDGPFMYVAMPYFVLMEAMVSCFIYDESIFHFWTQCSLFHFVIIPPLVQTRCLRHSRGLKIIACNLFKPQSHRGSRSE